MERFWNIVYYFAFRADGKATHYFYKLTGMFKFYELPFMKKHFGKAGIKDPAAMLMNVWQGPDIGLSSIFASAVVGGGHFFPIGITYLFENT